MTRRQRRQRTDDSKPTKRFSAGVLREQRLGQHDYHTGDRKNHLGEKPIDLRYVCHRFSATFVVRVTVACAILSASPLTAPLIARIQYGEATPSTSIRMTAGTRAKPSRAITSGTALFATSCDCFP